MKNFILIFLLFVFGFGPTMCETDVCGRYAILTKTDEFVISQPFTKEIAIDLSEYVQAFENINPNLLRFEDIAKNYSKLELIEKTEKYPLIPFTPERNLILINASHIDLPAICQKLKAKMLSFDPNEKQRVVEILKANNVATVPFFSLAMSKSLYSPNFKVLDSPPTPNVKLADVGTKYFPYLSAENGDILYASKVDTHEGPALCSKSNNFWDRSKSYMRFFAKTIQSILTTVPTVKRLSELTSDMVTVFSNLTRPNAQLISEKYVMSVPPSLTKIQTFLQKYNNLGNWENSKPSEVGDFLEYRKNFKELKQLFKKNNENPKTYEFFNFLQTRSAPIDFTFSDHQRLLTHLGMDPDRFGIAGPVQVRPLQSIQSSIPNEQSSAILAEVNFRLYDRQDVARIYDIKPIIFDNKITTAKYLVGLVRHAQATTSEPTPISCTHNEETSLKICEGFQTPGTEETHPASLLACGRALQSKNETIEIEKCPTTAAPHEALAYRAECDPGTRSVVLSSVRPLKITVSCDTLDSSSNIFEHFPVTLETECAIKEISNDTDRILLPQIQVDFFQHQKVGQVSTYRPPVTTPKPTAETQIQPAVLIAIGTSLTSVLIFVTVLAIYDPQRCADKAKLMCCCFIRLFYCCKTCCSTCCKCNPNSIEENQEHSTRRRIRNYYSSQNSIPSAPPEDEIAMNPILPAKSPAPSKRSSIHDIRVVQSDAKIRPQPNVVRSTRQ